MHDPTAALPSTPPASKGTFLTQLWDARTAKVLFTSLLFILVLAFLKAAHDTLLLFLFAILFAYFLAPLVGRLEIPLRGRGMAILVVYLLLGAVLTAIGLIAGPRVAYESRALATSLPSLLDRLGSGQLVSQLGQHYHWADSRGRHPRLWQSRRGQAGGASEAHLVADPDSDSEPLLPQAGSGDRAGDSQAGTYR